MMRRRRCRLQPVDSAYEGFEWRTAAQSAVGPLLGQRVARVVGASRRSARNYLRLSGTVPPLSISLAITCLCSHTFISAEPSSLPV
jgi:hypothetical protein